MLKYGRKGADFKSLGTMDFQKCASECCALNCDGILFLNDSCYHISCNNPQYDCSIGDEFDQKNSDSRKNSKLVIFEQKRKRDIINKRQMVESLILYL